MTRRSMRIHYVVTRGILGGAMVHVSALLRGLNEEVEAALIVGEDDRLAADARELGVLVTVVPELSSAFSPVNDLRAVRDARRAIREFSPDVVHAHSFKAGLIGRIAARREGVPTVFTAHGWSCSDEIPNPRRTIAWAAERLVAGSTDRVIVPAEVHRELAIRRHLATPDKVVVVRYGIDDASPSSVPRRSGTEITAVMVARFEAPKEQSFVVRALARLDVPMKLVFVGDGPNRDAVEDEVRALHLGDRVSFLGARTDVDRILADSDLVVLASRWEGQGLTLLEAMRSRLPVVASDVGGVSGAVVDGETGFLVPWRDLDAFADRIQRLCDDEGLRQRFGAAGRERYERLFRTESMLEGTLGVYRSVARSHRTTSS